LSTKSILPNYAAFVKCSEKKLCDEDTFKYLFTHFKMCGEFSYVRILHCINNLFKKYFCVCLAKIKSTLFARFFTKKEFGLTMQGVECLSTRCEALGLIPSTEIKK
jgi:hypothetical protein